MAGNKVALIAGLASGVAIGLGGGQLLPDDVEQMAGNQKVIELVSQRHTVPERKEVKEKYDSLGAYLGTDTVTIPAKEVAQLPTRDLWLDSTVKAGDVITVAVQHERGNTVIGNYAFRAAPTDQETDGKFRIKIMNVR